MKRLSILIVLFIAISILMSGCATMNTLDDTRNKSSKRVKSVTFLFPYDRVYQAARQSCLELGLNIYAEIEAEGKIYAKSSWRPLAVLINQGLFGYGEKIGIYFTKVDEKYTRVEVVNQKFNLLDLGYADWRQRILKLIAEHIKTEQ